MVEENERLQELMKRYNLAVSVYLTEYVAPGKPVISCFLLS